MIIDTFERGAISCFALCCKELSALFCVSVNKLSPTLVAIFSFFSYLLPKQFGLGILFALSGILCVKTVKGIKTECSGYILLLFTAVCVLSAFLNPLQGVQSFNSAVMFVLCVNCFFLFSNMKDWGMHFLLLLSVCSTIHVVFTLIQFWMPEFFQQVIFMRLPMHVQMAQKGERFIGLLGVTNQTSVIAFYITLGISTAVAYCIYKFYVCKVVFDGRNVFAVTLLLLAGITLLLTFKRAHLVANIIASLATIGIMAKGKSVFRAILSIVIAIYMFFFLFNFMHPEFADMIERFSLKSGFLSSRDILWDYALTLIERYPVFGCGFSRYGEYMQNDLGYSHGTHNIYIQLLCETGVCGLILFACFLLASVYHTSLKLRLSYKYCMGHNLLLLCWSFYFQIFFIIYGLTGNPLTDPFISVIFFISAGVPLISADYCLSAETNV